MTDLAAQRGDREVYEVTLNGADGLPINLSTALEVWFTAKRNVRNLDADAAIALTLTGGGIVVTDGPAGKATITVEPADTVGLSGRSIQLQYDVQVKDALGVVTTPIRGILTVEPDVTQAT